MEVVYARHRNYGKLDFFNPQDKQYRAGELVILEIDNKIKDYGRILIGNHESKNEKTADLPKVVRAVNNFDAKKITENKQREKKAFRFCRDCIKEKKLPMNLVFVEYSFDRKKLKFFFTSSKKVDFRGLLKELIEEFKIGVELRQIGVRDASKILGGIGICGRVVCCRSFLQDFDTINLKMARNQHILSGPDKISGICGRLRCCLKYEQDHYNDSEEE